MIVSTLLLSVSHVLPWLYLSARIERSPEKLASLLSGVMIFPYLLSLLLGAVAESGDYFDYYFLKFSAIYSVGMLFMYVGAATARLIFKVQLPVPSSDGRVYKKISFAAYLFLILSVFLVLLRFELAGGIFNYLADIGNRTKHLSGGGAVDIFMIPAVFLSVLSFSYLYSLGRLSKLKLVGIIIILFFIMSLFGGRKIPIQIVVFSLIYIAAVKVDFKLLSIKLVPIYFILFIFFSVVLYFRLKAQGNLETFDVKSVLGNTSYVDIYVFITKYFTENDFWYGAVYGDILYRISGLYGMLPLDDGVYIYNLSKGVEVTPPLSMEYMIASSWPPESYGSGFMNFGVLGVLIYFFVRGLVLLTVYQVAQQNGFRPVFFYIYIFVLFNFHLSNLRIVQLGMLILGVILLLLLARIGYFLYERVR